MSPIKSIEASYTRRCFQDTMKRVLYYISLPYATFGLVVEKGIVIEAAPIAKWTLNKQIDVVEKYYLKKNAVVQYIVLEEEK